MMSWMFSSKVAWGVCGHLSLISTKAFTSAHVTRRSWIVSVCQKCTLDDNSHAPLFFYRNRENIMSLLCHLQSAYQGHVTFIILRCVKLIKKWYSKLVWISAFDSELSRDKWTGWASPPPNNNNARVGARSLTWSISFELWSKSLDDEGRNAINEHFFVCI